MKYNHQLFIFIKISHKSTDKMLNKKQSLTNLLITVFVLLIVQPIQSQRASFPKKVWTYEGKGYFEASNVAKLCLLNMQHFVKQSGWQFMLLTQKNYTQFISNEDNTRLANIDKNIGNQKDNLVDFIRLFVLYQNGGMWLDPRSFLLGNLSWIEKLSSKTKGIYNNFGDYPQIITFTTNSFYGGKIWIRGGYINPGIETWCIIAIKNNKFLKDWINLVQLFLDIGDYGFMEPKAQGIKYIASNYVAQTVLRQKDKKQQEQNKTQAIQLYKMWSIDSKTGPFKVQFQYQWNNSKIWEEFTSNNLTSIKQKHTVEPYFITFATEQLNYTIEKINNYSANSSLKYDQPITQNSLFDEFLFKYGENHEFIYNMKPHKEDEQNSPPKIKPANKYERSKFYGFMSYLIIIAVTFVFYLKGKNYMRTRQRTSIPNYSETQPQNSLQIEEEPSSIKKEPSALRIAASEEHNQSQLRHLMML